MKPTDTLTTLFSHHLWANLLLLERCAKLTSEQLDTTISGTFGSIRDTLEHIITSEQSYFSRISTGRRLDRPDDAQPLTFAEMIESARTTGEGLIEWAPKVQADDTVEVDWEGVPRDVPKTIILTQIINHATEHRSQIMATMTQLGIEPPDLQGWQYFDEVTISTRIHLRVNAPRANVYAALLDSRAVETWMVPSGMTSQVHVFDAREGGSFRISLTYEAPTGTGKTTAQTDTYHGRFVKLVPNELVVEAMEFETDDAAMHGEMTITYTLADADGGTDVLAVHDNLPPGLSPADNETGWRMALDKLAALVEKNRQ
jgi:uncharacterized damage-inducible protein DinB/uncharacterized protein YndB with AHSA1/START domain